ncbi:MAG: alpha-glucuronidase family glycosyl hydrolase [Spirosomataceae bacterium]
MKLKLLFLLLCVSLTSRADDGYRLWLKFDLIKDAKLRSTYSRQVQFIVQESQGEIITTASKELQAGVKGLLGNSCPIQMSTQGKTGGVVLRVISNDAQTKGLAEDGFAIYSEKGNLVISSASASGVLYGSFELLRVLQTGTSIVSPVKSSPKVRLRMLNHWDNPLGTIERGYAGSSLWKWYELPEVVDARYQDYARANASIGINAVVLNNVNASARFLTAEYLSKVAALTKVFRPYGIKVYLSINFASPKILGKLKTSDPLDAEVKTWWQHKADEIYKTIPDFGGFLVKANSEGEPGPQEYGRTHADGANMLATALAPHKGIVIWRAFVYAADPNGDRFKEAYKDFKPLDGVFASNVIVQVKNGPIDFQSREPFHPLFGAMPKTPLAMEFQLTQEYLGFSTNLVYQAPLFKECLESDTYARGKGSTVAKVVDGSLDNHELSAIAGVANTGSDRNWTGHLMSQANWYAFGRLAWNHELSSEQIAAEWIKMTLTQEPQAVKTIQTMLMNSREVYVNFTTPLGLHHVMGQNIHFGAEPWLSKSARPDWTAVYYHRADSVGLGFDRTAKGSNALGLYAPEVQKEWGDAEKCPLPYLLWFHHVAWDKKLSTGKTLWDEFSGRYYQGVQEVEALQAQWKSVEKHVDPAMFADVAGRLAVQHREALNWRDGCVLYFQEFAKKPVPTPYKQPSRTLNQLKEITEIYQLK